MKILIHIHTFNAEDYIDRSLKAILEQSYAVENILLVDNASEDGTLDRLFPPQVTVIRNEKNLGVNAAIETGFKFALKNQYDWIWVLDSDSLPRKDTLAKLIDLYNSFDADEQKLLGVLCPTQVLAPTSSLFQGRRLTPGGPRKPIIDLRLPYCECDGNLWSGCLFRLEAVKKSGFSRGMVKLDFGKISFRIMEIRNLSIV